MTSKKEISGILVKYRGKLTTSFVLDNGPLSDTSKAELREVIAELQQYTKTQGAKMTFGHTDYSGRRFYRW